jgi:hypothetical protein
MTIVIGVRDDSKRVVRVGDGYDVVTSLHPVQQDLFRHREEILVVVVVAAISLFYRVSECPNVHGAECQSALRDPFDRRVLLVALAASELAGVAETP